MRNFSDRLFLKKTIHNDIRHNQILINKEALAGIAGSYTAEHFKQK